MNSRHFSSLGAAVACLLGVSNLFAESTAAQQEPRSYTGPATAPGSLEADAASDPATTETVEREGVDQNQQGVDEYAFGYPPQRGQDRQAVFGGQVSDSYRTETFTPAGMSATVGGGVTGFTDKNARQFTGTGGAWNVRLVFGTRTILGAELAYIGSGQDISALGLDNDAFLQSNGGEVAARLHLLPGLIQPYVLAGAGFTRYLLTNADANTSSVDDADNVIQFPLGVGAALHYERFVADVRGVFRPVTSGDLFTEEAAMHTWGANLSLGTEF